MGFEDYKPVIVMVGCQFVYAGVTLTGRAALLEEMSSRVFVVYRQCIAFLLIAPLAYFSSVTLNQNIYFEGLYLASSSAASALANLIPAITFVMAYTLGLEKVHLRSLRSIAKIIGTVFCVSGAAAMALLKGPKLLNMEFMPRNSIFLGSKGQDDTWLLGPCNCLLSRSPFINSMDVPNCSSAIWGFDINSRAEYEIVENDFPLATILLLLCRYGISSNFFAQAWCIAKRGPLFSAMFNPLCTVIVTVLACIFMHEELYTGSMIGGLAVIIGLYIVLWGKAKDHQDIREETSPMKKENDQTTLCTQVLDCKIDLEEPLLPENSANVDCDKEGLNV
ncbi:hypothetical protein DH2020_014152 [Rehmannia glutinosa]|uniref:WAT1-related protein n=1 Tax=Rehmannia glutinosa TaxID=99300 RepID=A0ABR0WVJ8_REHGL